MQLSKKLNLRNNLKIMSTGEELSGVVGFEKWCSKRSFNTNQIACKPKKACGLNKEKNLGNNLLSFFFKLIIYNCYIFINCSVKSF
jgi:hypothetical protein